MHVYRKIEIPSLFSATLVVFQLVFILVILKWKASSSAAKKEEIRKLAVWAEHETSMAEAEYMFNSSIRVTGTTPQYECAVCFSAATKRCSRCKAVRYCSGKCQIRHWRKGHKDECQPLDICQSSYSFSSSKTNDLDLVNSLLESKELGSPQCNLQGQKVFSSPVQNIDHYISGISEFSSSNLPQVSTLCTDCETSHEAPRPSFNNATNSVPKATRNDGPNDLSGTRINHIPMPVMPTSDKSAYEVPGSCSLYTSNILSSSAASGKDPITTIFDSINPVSDMPAYNKSLKDPSLSMDSDSPTDYMTSSISSEHGLHSCTNLTHNSSISESDMLDHHINKSQSKNNSTNSDCNSLFSGSPSHDYISNKSHVIDASRHSTAIHDSPGNMPMLDEPCWRSFADDGPDSEYSSSVVANGQGRLWQFNDNISSSSNDAAESQSASPIELSSSVSEHELWSSESSLLKGTLRRSIGTAIQYFSRQKAKASPTILSHVNGCDYAVSSSTSSTVGSSQNNSSGFKRSVKKVLRRAKSSKMSKQTNPRTVEEVLAKPSQILFPYEYFVELFNCNTLELYPCGLINCGNSCYANVVLQCLTYTRPITAYLLQGCHAEYCKRKNWCLICELEHLILMVRQSKSPVSPTRILSRIQRMRAHLGYGRQEDAHELLRLSIEAMQSICIDEAGGEKEVNSAMQKTTFIQQIFGGCLQSKVQCMRCHYESDRFENMLDLTIEINGNIQSLEDALSQFTAPELLDGENKYKCNRCKSYVTAKKRLIVHEAPNILTIALKRFKNGKFGKLSKHVTFPEFLDMSPYMSGTADEPPLYMLYAVIVHLDMFNASFFGHYVCYVKDLHGAWYKIDDTEVQPVKIDTVMAESAYMLWYSRSSPRPPYVLENGTAQACTAAPLDPRTYNSWQSFVTREQNESCIMNSNQFSSPNLRATRIDEIDSDVVWSLGGYANDAQLSDTYNLDAYGFTYERIPSATADWDINSTREYTDFTYSDTGSLFSGSDEASWSTDSYRDSTSTAGSC